MTPNLRTLRRLACSVAFFSITWFPADAATLTGAFFSIPQGSNVDLTISGPVDWVHWGLYTETSLDRKAGVTPRITDFTRLDAANGYSYVYQFSDNYNGYSWTDGTPTPSETNTTTGVWAYGVPATGSGFQVTAPADTTQRTLHVYVGAFKARGKFEAALSDNSAPLYTDSSLINRMTNGDSAIYSISYSAQSAGQSLTIKWTVSQAFGADANVTLQSAALSIAGANNPPSVAITSPGDNATFDAGSDITIMASAADPDGSVTLVEFFAGANKLGEAAGSPFSFTWANVPAGVYSLTARATDNGGASTVSGPVEISVNGTGGSLMGAATLPPTGVDLTAEGNLDWAHWGLTSAVSFDHKAGVPQQISNFTEIGTNGVQQYSDNFTAYNWSDGTPTASTNGTKTGVFIHGLTNGFLLSVPADSQARTLKVYVGLYAAQGVFQAYLSDFSAPAFTDSSLSSFYDNLYAVYTLNYAAASAGQSLRVTYTAKTLFDADFGNVTLQAATFSGPAPPTNSPPTVAITDPTNNATYLAGANITIQAGASDTDGSVAQVQFFAGTNLLGTATANPYSVTWTNVPVGDYNLTAKATNNQGATSTSSAVNISVVNNAPAAVTLVDPMLSGNNFSLSFTTQSGVAYSVQFTDSLSPITWSGLTNFGGTGTTFTVTDTTAAAQRFYRVRSP